MYIVTSHIRGKAGESVLKRSISSTLRDVINLLKRDKLSKERTITYFSSSSFSSTDDTIDLNNLAFSSLKGSRTLDQLYIYIKYLYIEAASYALMGISLAKISEPVVLGSDG